MDAVYVVGAGGIGCAAGYALRAAGARVVFVDANPAKIENGQRGGVQVNDRPPLAAEFVHFDLWQPAPDVPVLLCTKCYDNAAVLARLAPGVQLIPIQNGFDPQLEAFGHEVEAIASFVSECAKDTPHTRITRPGELHIGPRSASNTSAPASGGRKPPKANAAETHQGKRREDERHENEQRENEQRSAASVVGDSGGLRPPLAEAKVLLAEVLRSSDLFRVVKVANIEPIKHAKLMYNAAISPLAAAAGIDNGKLLSVPEARTLFFGLLQENYRTLSAAGIELGKVGPFHPRTVAWILRRKWLAGLMARGFEPSLRGTYCSMAGEIQKGRTEIDNYNGYLIRLAEEARVPCPLNRAVFDLVTRMTAGREAPRSGVFQEIAQVAARQTVPVTS